MGVLKKSAEAVWNAFCPTGIGGGRDPTCGLGGKSGGGSAKAEPVGGMASRSGRKLARQMGRADKAAKAKASAGKSLQQKLEEDDAAKKAIKDKRTEAVKRTAKEHGISEKDAKKYLRDSPGMAVGPSEGKDSTMLSSKRAAKKAGAKVKKKLTDEELASFSKPSDLGTRDERGFRTDKAIIASIMQSPLELTRIERNALKASGGDVAAARDSVKKRMRKAKGEKLRDLESALLSLEGI